MATAVDASLANDDAQRRATIMSNLTASPTPVGGFFLPEAVLREMLAFFSLDELLVLEDVDVLWREAIAASGAWARISVRHEQDASKVERLVTRVATRHGRETRYLEIVNCALTNSVLVEVGHHFTNVQQLIVSGCKGLGDDGFCSLVSASRAAIVEIRAVRCPMLTDAALVCANAHHAESLESVDFSHCRFVTSSGVSSLVQNASRLAYVGLKGCPKVNDSAVAAVTLHCSKVKTLLLGGSGVISDASLRAIADNCSQLETLDIARSNPFGIGRGGVSDDGLNYLASKCANIQQLILRGQGRLSSASLVSLPANCTRLQTLDIGGCRGIVQDPAVLCGVLKRISQLEKLSVSFCGGMVEEHHVSSIASECRTLKTFEVDGETIVAAASS